MFKYSKLLVIENPGLLDYWYLKCYQRKSMIDPWKKKIKKKSRRVIGPWKNIRRYKRLLEKNWASKKYFLTKLNNLKIFQQKLLKLTSGPLENIPKISMIIDLFVLEIILKKSKIFVKNSRKKYFWKMQNILTISPWKFILKKFRIILYCALKNILK